MMTGVGAPQPGRVPDSVCDEVLGLLSCSTWVFFSPRLEYFESLKPSQRVYSLSLSFSPPRNLSQALWPSDVVFCLWKREKVSQSCTYVGSAALWRWEPASTPSTEPRWNPQGFLFRGWERKGSQWWAMHLGELKKCSGQTFRNKQGWRMDRLEVIFMCPPANLSPLHSWNTKPKRVCSSKWIQSMLYREERGPRSETLLTSEPNWEGASDSRLPSFLLPPPSSSFFLFPLLLLLLHHRQTLSHPNG